ncbi:MAG TPA: hypothetical protein ENK23_03870, partial [Sorangium sp.]|nr:hypothetical protein [Sorangium sp.]
MKMSSRLFSVLVLLLATAIPAVATAQPTALGRTLEGTALDPAATTIRVVPPRGGTVLVYQKGKLVGWWTRPGMA